MNSNGRCVISVWMALAAINCAGSDAAEEPTTLIAHESGMRGTALVAPMPTYPVSSFENRTTGVAVAEVVVGPGGQVERATVLEAPDPAISDSVRATVKTWAFPPPTTPDLPNRKFKMQGKLTFYFDINGGKGSVLSPEQKRGQNVDTRGVHKGWIVDNPYEIEFVTETEAASLKSRESAVTLDTRPSAEYQKGHRKDAVNIGVRDLEGRARVLIERKPIILDCVRMSGALCRESTAELRRLGFHSIYGIRTESD